MTSSVCRKNRIEVASMKTAILAGIQVLLIGACLPILTQAQSVTVKYENGYDKAITVNWENSNPSNGEYIALYKGWQTIHDNLSFFSITAATAKTTKIVLLDWRLVKVLPLM